VILPLEDYEYGRLLVCAGEIEAGKAQLELVYSGKTLEVNASGKRGKYSMEVSFFFPTTKLIY
jgi:hypothetical protein